MHAAKLRSLIKTSMVVAVAGALVLVVTYYQEENSSPKSPTEYEKTQQVEPRNSINREPQPPANREPRSHQAATSEKPDQTANQLAQAWNQGSSREIANLFAPDGELTIPGGSKIQSKSEIAKTIDEKRGGLLKETTLSSTVDEVSQVDANTAIVKGRYQLSGIKILGFSKTATGTFVFRQRKSERRWLISEAEVKNGDGG